MKKKKLRLKYALLGMAAGLALAGTSMSMPLTLVHAEDDTASDTQDEGFKISEIIFSPDTASPGDKVSVRALTNSSKYNIFSLMMEIPVNESKTEKVYLTHGENDILEGSFTIGDNWSNGSHSVKSVTVISQDQSETAYDFSDTTMTPFTVQNSNEDYDAPVVSAVKLDKANARVGETVDISVELTHASEVEEIIVTFADEGNVAHSVSFEGGATTLTKDLSGWSEGSYRVREIFVRDKSGNRVYYEENDNLSEVELPLLTISNEYADTQGPIINSVSFDKTEASPGDTVTITANGHDSSGISFITIEIANIRDEKEVYYLFDNGEGAFTGTVDVSNKFLNGEYKITHISAQDMLGNTSDFVPGEDTKDIETGTFTVKNSLQDREAPLITGIEVNGTNLKPRDKCIITFSLSDASEIWQPEVQLYRTDTNDLFKTYKAELLEDGRYSCEFRADNQWYNGEYDIRINASDSLQNSGSTPVGIKLTVHDSAEDYQAPELTDISAEKTTLSPGDNMNITALIKEASRVDHIYGELVYLGEYDEDDSPYYDTTQRWLIFEEKEKGVFSVSKGITNGFYNGDYKLLLHTCDEWDNYEDNIETELTFTIKDSAQDREGPELISVTFDKDRYTPGDTLNITAEARDPNGVTKMSLYLSPMNTERDYINLRLIIDIYPDENGEFHFTEKINNHWVNDTYMPLYAELTDAVGNTSYYNYGYEFEGEIGSFEVYGSKETDSELSVSSLLFDKAFYLYGEQVTVTAKVEGETDSLKAEEIEISLENNSPESSSTWSEFVSLYPVENEPGILRGTFRIDKSDIFWKKYLSYGVSQIYLSDTDNNARFYISKGDAELTDDLRDVETNRFSVRTFAPPAFNRADYTETDAALSEVPEDLSIYTEESRAALKKVIFNIDRGLYDDEQDIVDEYPPAIRAAIAALEEIKTEIKTEHADYTEVNKAIESIPEDLSIYTKESVDTLNEAVQAVVRGLNSDEQTKVDAFAEAIEAAIKTLEKKPEEKVPEKTVTKEKSETTPKTVKANAAKKIEQPAPAVVEKAAPEAPKTGDSNATLLLAGIAGASGAGAVAAGVVLRRRRKDS